MGADHSLHTLR